ncbi:MAG: YncE family protein [Pyrinomonadaceae bacterium]
MKILTVQFLSLLFFIVSGFVLCDAQTQPKTQTSGGYHLLNTIQVGGEGGWDLLYADADAHRLYVSHATKVVVIDTETEKVVGEIPNTNGVHGIAVAEDLGRGFISDGRDNAVTIFDLKTLKTLSTVPVGKNPDTIIYDSASKRVFAFNAGSSDITAIDAASGSVAGTIALGGKPEFAAADGKGMIFVNLEDKSEIVPVDSRKLEAKAHWSLAPGEEPSGMAIDRKNHRLFVVCGNKKMIVVNYDNGKIVGDLPTGDGTDAAAFDPNTKLAFSSNGEGTLTVVREDAGDKFSVAENVTTRRGARTMALDTKTHKVYLATAQFGATPAPTAERPRPRPAIVPDSFVILVYGK